MEIKGFELKQRTAYDTLISYEGDNVLLNYVKIVYDSIKRNWNVFNKFWYRIKYSPSKLLKILTEKEIIEAVKFIRLKEGVKEDDLAYINFQLGLITQEEFLEWLKVNKKKVETIQSITKL